MTSTSIEPSAHAMFTISSTFPSRRSSKRVTNHAVPPSLPTAAQLRTVAQPVPM
jgi:hypothetical protein